jgi:AMMECR1 domain-containing protein
MFRVSDWFARTVLGHQQSTQRLAINVIVIEEPKLWRRRRAIAAEHIRWGRRITYLVHRGKSGWRTTSS